MISVNARITPLSAFGTLLKGDTLFGQFCWAIRNHLGESRLRKLLEGYTNGLPFAVVSDALPSGYLPRPVLPMHWFVHTDPSERKQAKKKIWLPMTQFDESITNWPSHFVAPDEKSRIKALPQPHNVIDRRSGTTGEGFSPYNMTQHWYADAPLDIHIALDDSQLSLNELRSMLENMGAFGYGRDASIGLGKFRLDALQTQPIREQQQANAWLTLAPSAPQNLILDAERCFYQVFTRFGRHGDAAVHSGKPFKAPVLMAQTGAVLTPKTYETRSFIGSGLGGDGSLSNAVRETVQQGYAPVVGIRLPTVAEKVA